MFCKPISCALVLVGFLTWLPPSPASAQADPANVSLIMLNPKGTTTADLPRMRRLYAGIKKRAASAADRALTLTKAQVDALRKAASRRGVTVGRAGERSRLRRLYAAIKQRAASASGRALTLTKTELWSVPKEKAEAVMKAAARHGVIMARLGDTWNQVFHSAPADIKVTGRQKWMMERAGGLQGNHGRRPNGGASAADGGIRAVQGR